MKAHDEHGPYRNTGPSEQRLISRHVHRFYNNLLVAGIYSIPVTVADSQLSKLETYLPVLKACLLQHPFLSIVVRRNAKGQSVYARADAVDLRDHFHVIDAELSASNTATEDTLIGRVIEHLCNDPALTFFDTAEVLPHWRLDVLPLQESAHQKRVFISFTYGHTIGDGMSGMVFQKTFLEAFHQLGAQPPEDTNPISNTAHADLPGLPHLPLTLSYLLGPALGHYLPRFVADWLGIKASVSGSDEATWSGKKTFLSSASSEGVPVTTAAEVLSISDNTVTAVLETCRKHDAKLTSLLHEIVAQCFNRHLSSQLVLDASQNNFVASTPTNLRRLVDVPDETIGIFSSTAYSRHDIDRSLNPESEVKITEHMWSKSRADTTQLHRSVSLLRNQPIALLSWISDIDAWMASQLNKPRDVSWEMSNLLSFGNRSASGGTPAIVVEKMFFGQSAEAAGSPLFLSVVSVKGGDLVICASWQPGAFGFNTTENSTIEIVERRFVRSVLDDLKRYMDVAASQE
ncbi:Alcohol acetyltransferase [Lithohypha guttulata]|uniref:Alcohol acetyltransferase n=1 Tax=Lithohypha guttulata TaxID=1690604 RepID=UPI002DE066C3|nr:Alcohol acetyltransferase [Lithohypha guttulata]